MPFAFFKELGIGAMNRAFGGMLPASICRSLWSPSLVESNQGSFISIFDVQCFMPVDQFKSEMDRFISEARAMRPFPGFEQAELPGGLEWQRERDYARDGIPVSAEHQQSLQDLADELQVETPFEQYEHTRFCESTMPRVLTSVHIEFKGRSPATEMMEDAGFEVVMQPPYRVGPMTKRGKNSSASTACSPAPRT